MVRFPLFALVSSLGLVVIGPSGSADAAGRPGEQTRLLLLVPQGAAAEQYGSLETALQAHLEQYAVAVESCPVAAVPKAQRAQERQARGRIAATGASAVVWVDVERGTVALIYMDDSGNEKTLKRELDCVATDLEKCRDAIAVVVNFAISGWLIPKTEDAPEDPAAEPAFDNELAPLALTKQPWRQPDPVARLQLLAGYGAVFFKGTVGASHGFGVGAGAVLLRYAIAQASFDFFWHLDGSALQSGASLSVGRWDASVRIGGLIPWERWSLALCAGVTADRSRIVEKAPGLDVDRESAARFGFSATLEARFRINRWLALVAGSGVELFAADAVFSAGEGDGDKEPLVRLGAIQGRVFAAAELGFGLGRLEAR